MSNIYYTLTGLAYQKGIDSFESVMPEERVHSLYKACLETKGFDWCANGSFVRWILAVAGREGRKNRPPECSADCKYRMPYETPQAQVNALRVEIFSPADRCGWNLKSGRVGGRPDDYHPCTFVAHN